MWGYSKDEARRQVKLVSQEMYNGRMLSRALVEFQPFIRYLKVNYY